MRVEQAIEKIKKEIKTKGYRENMCYPIFYELQKSIKDKPYSEQAEIEKRFWNLYFEL